MDVYNQEPHQEVVKKTEICSKTFQPRNQTEVYAQYHVPGDLLQQKVLENTFRKKLYSTRSVGTQGQQIIFLALSENESQSCKHVH